MVQGWLQRVHDGLMERNVFYQNLMRLLRGNGYPGPKANAIYTDLMNGEPVEAVLSGFHFIASVGKIFYPDLHSGNDSYIVSGGGGYGMANFDISSTTLEEIAEDLLQKFPQFNFVFRDESAVVSFVNDALQDAYNTGLGLGSVFSAKASDRGKDKAELAVDEISERLESNLVKLLSKSSGSLSGSTFHVLCKNALLEAYMRGEWVGRWGDKDNASPAKAE